MEPTWFRARILKQFGYYLDASWYCGEDCLEKGVIQLLERNSQPREKSFQNLMRIKLGHILLEMGTITKEQLDHAIAEQQRGQDEKIGRLLIALEFVRERDITLALSRQFNLPVITVSNQKINPMVLNMVPIEIIRNSKFFPLEYDSINKRLVLVTFDPSDVSTMINLRSILDCEIAIYLSDESVVRGMIDQYCIGSAELLHDLTIDVRDSEPKRALSELAAKIVLCAQEMKARSLNLRFFNQQVWARFFVDKTPRDLVLHLAASDSSGGKILPMGKCGICSALS
ncbi:MAG: hypothetical protein U0V70_19445 [Terriglobia bacterium]